MNYAELHYYITTVQANLNSMRAPQQPSKHLEKLMEIKRLTDDAIRKLE